MADTDVTADTPADVRADVPTAVVTGAARGIGRAIAARLVREGWRVVVNDLDAAELASVAAQIGADAVPGDAASDAGVRALVDAATARLGRVDVFFANAGIGSLSGIEATDEEWARVLDVNLLAHVRAARALVPGWLERGSGRFVVTASAAGLLTMLGDAPYSVTKHGAVAFAEWLSATYRHRGIVVQAICPQGVQTRMLDRSGPLKTLLTRDPVVSADDVAEAVWQALQGDTFLVLPHPEVRDYAIARVSHPDAWLSGMNRMQQRLDVPSPTPAAAPHSEPTPEPTSEPASEPHAQADQTDHQTDHPHADQQETP